MKKFFIVIIALSFLSCSFDNKTGIWNDASSVLVDMQDSKYITNDTSNSRYEDIVTKNKIFNEEKVSIKNFTAKITKPMTITKWVEQYAVPSNNISNFSYSGNNTLLSKSPKLVAKFLSSKNNTNKNIVFYEDNFISHDHKGEIFMYSPLLKEKVFKYNFYKKKFKNFDKEIFLIINKNILYAADNLGYIYAINLEKKSIIWAKNYGIPFRSNLKIIENQIFLANQDNVIYSIDLNTGEKKWQFATNTTFLKADFNNNFALDLINNNLFFLNTSGELYSLNYKNQKINWVLNFKNSRLAEDTELFLSQPIIFKNNKLTVTTEKSVLNINTLNSSKNWQIRSEPIFKPIVTNNYTYIITRNDLLISIDNESGNIIWSKNIYKQLKDKKNRRKLKIISDFKLVNSEINIFFKKGHVLAFDVNTGNLNYINKISKNGISSVIFFLKKNMLFVDNKNKLLKFN